FPPPVEGCQDGGERNPLLVSLEDKSERQQRDTGLWFGKGVFSSLDFDADESLEIRQTQILQDSERGVKPQKRQTGRRKQNAPNLDKTAEETAAITETAAETTATTESTRETAKEDLSSSESDSSEDEREIKSMKGSLGKKRAQAEEETDNFEVVPVERPVKRSRVLGPDSLALGTVIATSKKSTRDLIDGSFHRYTFNEDEDELPDWFATEERKHRIRQLPVNRQMMQEYRERQRELNARPIKKVAEAKARKRRRMLKKMEQAKQKAETVVNTVDISEKEKAAQLRGIYKKAGLGKEKREVTYLVAKKGVGPKVRRPPGVKGHFKVVDGRMKKDMRGQQRRDQRQRKRK
ncbi:pre-rRNA 2'-O-ribose RNA methyltransferase FTSJ3-like, partial [Ascaphus truei]|uniref:pre-rRNA 2'-O-ribose RNA methyltransferase FTSJ3-like n=1 Tax=Ascaphus truei TaxID=8439 RepID=UPI003F5A9CC0